MSRRPKPPVPWTVELDEHHPNHHIAAKYADQEARLFTRRHLSDLIKRLEAKEELTAEETKALWTAMYHLKLTNEAIAEFDSNEKEDS